VWKVQGREPLIGGVRRIRKQAVSREAIYSTEYVRGLFDGMAATYGVTNLISSLGFCQRWRAQCIALVPIEEGMVVFDLMSGMGECWPGIARRLGTRGSIVGVDFCPAMCKRAERTRVRLVGTTIQQRQEDFLVNSIPNASADCVVSSFGLKTFSAAQHATVASEIARILKPGAHFSLLEISVPKAGALRAPYMFYLKYCVPLMGAVFLGNPDNYRLLGVYAEEFVDCSAMGDLLRTHGLEVEFCSLFFGCATALHGRRTA
jgi:demethylmenaquinone methyltransferase/2-methoxy-6-polyprenyl-1,4-benzoquinol methylase